uniref:Uncharacterized protein n=1 Tax=Burkholderia cenocepacia TaxID=95486 RepID=A0A071MHC8_9BURK
MELLLHPMWIGARAEQLVVEGLERARDSSHRIVIVLGNRHQSKAYVSVSFDVWQLQEVPRINRDFAWACRKVQRQRDAHVSNWKCVIVEVHDPGMPFASTQTAYPPRPR